jgi:hypothetical protein
MRGALGTASALHATDDQRTRDWVGSSRPGHDGWVSLPDTQPLRINANKYRVSGVFYPEPRYSLALRESERDPIEIDFGVPATTVEDARLYVQDYLTDGRAKIGMNREM